MIFFGLLSKFGALFVTIPEPIIGGIFCIMFGMVTAVGLSNLQFVNLNSTRNLFVLGFSLFFGLALSKWAKAEPEAISFGQGSTELNNLSQVIKVLLQTSMFVSGFLGFILDNTIPGTEEERGLTAWKNQHGSGEAAEEKAKHCYDIPFVTPYLEKWKWAKYVPFFPTYQGLFSKNKIHPK